MHEPDWLDFDLGDRFWATFIAEYWERKPCTLRGLLSRAVLEPDELMSGLQRMFREILRTGPRGGDAFRILADNRLLQGGEVGRIADAMSEPAFPAFVAAAASALRCEELGIILSNFGKYCPPLWHRSRAFIHPIVQQTGLPPHYTHSGLFGGNYRKTAFGIHQDQSSGFMFPVIGRKTILAWPEEYFQDKAPVVRRHVLVDSPRDYMADAVALSGGPGDVLYWPATYWHCGYDDTGDVHAAVTIGFWTEQDCNQFVCQKLVDALVRQLPSHTNREWVHPAAELPAARASTAACIAGTLTPAYVDRVTRDEWLRQVSSGGFLAVPPLRDVERTSIASEVQLLYPPVVDNQRVYANGHALEPAAREALERLPLRQWVSARWAVGDDHDQGLVLLTFLKRAGALLERCAASPHC